MSISKLITRLSNLLLKILMFCLGKFIKVHILLKPVLFLIRKSNSRGCMYVCFIIKIYLV